MADSLSVSSEMSRYRPLSTPKGIDGPAWLTYQQFELDSFTNMLFLFCGRHRGHIKGLYLEKDGIIMLYKRLGQGVVPVDAFGI